MVIEMGKPVKEITFEENGTTIWVKPMADSDLIYISEYHGDHSENWIVGIQKNNKEELFRYNTKYLTSITWITNKTQID